MNLVILHEIGCYIAAKQLGFNVSGIEIRKSIHFFKNCMLDIDFNIVISNKTTLRNFCRKKIQFLLAGSVTSMVWEGMSVNDITKKLIIYKNNSALKYEYDFYKITEICLLLANIDNSSPGDIYEGLIKKTIKMIYGYQNKINNLYNNLSFRIVDNYACLTENEINSIFTNEIV
jgi:hypothetical protein